MTIYRHHVSGFFAHRVEAEKVFYKLIRNGLPRERVRIFDRDSVPPKHLAQNSSDSVLTNILVDGSIGAAVGTGLGALVEIGLIAANVTLFVASPLIAPLTVLGWGASLGGLTGASIGAAQKSKQLSNLVHDAILNGQFVVVAETLNKKETAIAAGVIEAAVGDYSDAV